MRVAARRTFSVVKCFGPPVLGPQVKGLRKTVKAVLKSGAAVRDWDIVIETAEAAGIEGESPLRRSLVSHREAQGHGMLDVLSATRFDALTDRATDQAKSGQSTPIRQKRGRKVLAWIPGKSSADNARRVLPGLVSEYFASGRTVCKDEPDISSLHELRLLGKQVRYVLEVFRDCYEPNLEANLTSLKTVQRRLGTVSDCDTSERLVRRAGLANSPDAEPLLAYLDECRRRAVVEFLELWRTRFDATGEEEAWVRQLRNSGRRG